MDASHILVGGLTAVTLVLLIWIEIRSRGNTAAESGQESVAGTAVELQPLAKRATRTPRTEIK
ncbi:MAG TPA: hypothetical protein VFU86_08850 [Terriglobales bacterium]|nr:hypothetical protein [Terriglobales bacterium]